MKQRFGLINDLRIRYVGIFAFLILLSGLIIKFDQEQARHLRAVSEKVAETLYWEGRIQEGVVGLIRSQGQEDTPAPDQDFDTLDLVMLSKSLRDSRRALEGYQALENRRTAGGLLLFLGSCIGVWISLSIPRIAALVEEIRAAAATLARSSEEIQKISVEHLHQSSRQAEAVVELAATSEDLATSAASIRGNAEAMKESMGGAQAACTRGRDQLDQITQEMAALQMQVEGIDESMVALGDVATRISSITEIIDEISDQTKLLALNAAIEAAGAGESGKRFAVVATEVRRLSERTADATGQIATLVQEMENRVRETSSLTSAGTAAVERGANEIRHAGEGLQEIFETVEATGHQVIEISSSTERQKQSTEFMTQTVGEVRELVSGVLEGAENARLAALRLGPLVGGLRGLVDGVVRSDEGETEGS